MAKRSKNKQARVAAQPPQPAPTALPWKTVIQVLLIVLIGLWIYGPALRGMWLWDDDVLVTQNTNLPTVHGLWKIWHDVFNTDYWPLTWTVFWLEWHFWGPEPLGFHLVSLCFHLANCCLLWHVLRRLGLRWGWLAALIFAVHPLVVETGAWIAETKNTLSLFFFLLSFDAWLDQEEGRRLAYLRSLLFFLAAMLCKSSVITLPIVLLGYDWWKRGRIRESDIWRVLPYFAISIVLGLVGIYLQTRHPATIGANVVKIDPLYYRPAVVGVSTLFYLGKFFVPVGFLPIYPRWDISPPTFMEWLTVPLFSAIFIGLWILRRHNWARHTLFGLGFFMLTAAPILGVSPMLYSRISRVADHLVYLPMIGLIAIVVAGLETGTRRLPSALRPVSFGVIAIILGLLAWGSHQYSGVFVSQHELFSYTVARNLDAWPAQNDLGYALLDEGKFAEAAEHLKNAIRVKPDYGEAHNNLGLVYLRTGLKAKGEPVGRYEQSLSLTPGAASTSKPTSAFSQAAAEFRRALEIDPHSQDARGNLALAEQDEAATDPIAHYEQVLAANPNDVNTRNNLGLALLQAGKIPQACAQFEQVLRTNPDYVDSLSNLGLARLQQARGPEAVGLFERALKIRPDFAEAHNNLGLALCQIGHPADAIPHYEEALKLKPGYDAARGNLTLAQQQLRNQPAPPR